LRKDTTMQGKKRMRHSKFKNTGILFELLTRQVTADILAGKQESSAKDLLFKYFKENTELSKEWQLYSSILNQKHSDIIGAERFLSVILESRKRLSNKQLNNEKYLLIKEIKDNYPLEELFKAPIRNYRMLASIFKVFEDGVSNEVKFNLNEVFQAKTCIVEHIADRPKSVLKESEDEQLIDCYKRQSSETRLLAYELLLEKLNSKYNTLLDDNQKSVLREYICNIANTNSLGNFVRGKVTEVKTSLNEVVTGINDNVARIKVSEVVNQLDKVNPDKIVKDNQIMVLLLSYELLKECRKQLAVK
jgi:hypothetical protein